MASIPQLRFKEIEQFDNFLFDADGVLWRGDGAIPGAAEFIKFLRSHGKKIFVITNNSTKTREQYAEKMVNLGLDVKSENIFSPAVVLPLYLKEHGFSGKKVYLVGTKPLKESLENDGGVKCIGIGQDLFQTYTEKDHIFDIDLDPEVVAVITSFDGHISYPKIMRAANYLQNKDIEFFVTNEDYTFPGPLSHILVPGSGVMAAAIRAASDREPIVFGKPGTPIADHLKEHFHIDPTKTIMFGDRLDTDIEFAYNNGFSSCLMLTGVHNLSNVQAAQNKNRPQHVPTFQFAFEPFLASLSAKSNGTNH